MIPKHPVIGIDLGGTKISTALTDDTGTIIAHDYRETLAAEGQKAVIRRMLDSARQVMAQAGVTQAQVVATGIGAPGPLDIKAGVVMAPPNLPGWDRVPLKQLVENELGIATFLENDANAAALGEHRFGAGRGTEHMIYVTVSTGIGGGLILDGKLYHGISGAAGEIGHITIMPNGPRCGCGNRGCLEALASGTAIARQARERVTHGVPTLIADLAEGIPERITAKLVAEAASRGDIEAQDILAEAMNYLGIGMANLVNLFNPQLIVIGGGLTNIGELLFGPVRRVIARRAFRTPAREVQVVRAELGDHVGVLGAAAVALAQIGWREMTDA
ncbi:MAG: ROK family protein [Chloroflexota bacterium]|nr:ROK family protein [Chloroflexota bacterium]